MANIAIDSIALQGAMGKGRGIGNYTKSQLLKVFEKDIINEYYYLDLYGDFALKDEIDRFDNVHYECFFCGRTSELIREKEFSDVYGGIIKNFIKENNIDIFYITSPFDPTVSIYQKEWFENTKVIATVYDVIPYVMRDYYFRFLDSKWYLRVVEFLKQIDHVLVISDSVKHDLVNYLGFDSNKITVMYGAPGKQFQKIQIDGATEENIRNKFSITDKFLLCTGGDDYRKNLDGLIKAYSKLDDTIKEEYQLVIVCKLSKESEKKYKAICLDEGIENKVVFTNFVTDEELVYLYNMATLLVFPSKYEGFGLPIVEAWACGTGVVASNNSSLGEIVGEAGVLVDPNAINSISTGIANAVPRYKELANLGEERLTNYSWELVAETTIDAINELEDIVEKVEDRRPRIAMFSPFPPQRSGIADYSYDICMELAKEYSIDVYVEDLNSVDQINDCNIKTYSHLEFKNNYKNANYRRIIYQMGNSNFHFYMYKYIFKFPGVIVLHDYNLNGAFIDYCTNKYGRFNKRKYIKIASSDYDNKYIRNIVNTNQLQGKAYEIELNSWLINHAEGVIVHSEYAQRKLLERNVATIVNKIPLYAVKEEKSVEKEKNSNSEILIGIFGFVHPIKRPEQIMRAVSLLKRQGKKVKLVLVGYMDDTYKNELSNLSKELDIENDIECTGYTTLEQFEDYLNRVDICLNLRYPNNGESSASFTRMLAAGKCAVVNNVGSFSEYPDEVCVKIPPSENLTESEEVVAIYDALHSLIDNPESIARIGASAREYAEKCLSIERIGGMYKAVIEGTQSIKVVNQKLIDNIKTRFVDGEHYSNSEISELSKTLSLSKGSL